MLPDPVKIMQAPYVVRDPETGEISWPPPDIELELMELGLIPRRNNEQGLDVEPKQKRRREDRVVYTQRRTLSQTGTPHLGGRGGEDGGGIEEEDTWTRTKS